MRWRMGFMRAFRAGVTKKFRPRENRKLEIQGKTIAVTGGGRGIGRAIAVGLAGKGARIALVDLDEAPLAECESLCKDAGGEARSYIADVSNEEQVVNLFDGVARDFGALDGLVNNAGIVRDGLLVKAKEGKVVGKMSLDKWQAVIGVNLTGVFLCAREAAARMIGFANPGVIVNISSISRSGNFGQTNYTAAKAGVVGMTVTWAKELARYGIRVAAISPGYIGTEMVAAMPPEALERMTGPALLKRLGTPEEIAHTVAFVFENDFVTGRNIEVDGGLRI